MSVEIDKAPERKLPREIKTDHRDLGRDTTRLVVILFPWRVSRFIYADLEIDVFDQKAQVRVFDLSQLLHPEVVKHDPSLDLLEENIVHTTTLVQLMRDLIALRSEMRLHAKIYIIDHLPRAYILDLFFKIGLGLFFITKSVKYIEYKNVGYFRANTSRNGGAPKVMKRFVNVLRKLRRPVGTNFKIIAIYLLRLIETLIFYKRKIILYGSQIDLEEDGVDGPLRMKSKIYGSSQDFSRALRQDSYLPSGLDSSACFISPAGPKFKGDRALNKHYPPFDVQPWFSHLNLFFEHIESNFLYKVCILGHYKSAYDPISCEFGGRQVFYNQAILRVKRAGLVLAVNSTAISLAVIFRKPLMLLTSRQLMLNKEIVFFQSSLSEYLGVPVINIDYPESYKTRTKPDSIREERYAAYERDFLTSGERNTSNAELILRS